MLCKLFLLLDNQLQLYWTCYYRFMSSYPISIIGHFGLGYVYRGVGYLGTFQAAFLATQSIRMWDILGGCPSLATYRLYLFPVNCHFLYVHAMKMTFQTSQKRMFSLQQTIWLVPMCLLLRVLPWYIVHLIFLLVIIIRIVTLYFMTFWLCQLTYMMIMDIPLGFRKE